MSDAQAKNLERLNQALGVHDSGCPFPVQEICMNPFEVERLGWDSYPWKGKDIPISGDSRLPTGRFRLVCPATGGGVKEEVEVELDLPKVGEKVTA
jgi:hypothetical protein